MIYILMYTFRGRPERTLGGRRCCLFSKRQSDRKARPLIHSSPADCFEKRPRRNAAFSVAKLKESITPVHLVRPSLVRVHCYEHTHTGCKSGVPREKKSSRLLRAGALLRVRPQKSSPDARPSPVRRRLLRLLRRQVPDSLQQIARDFSFFIPRALRGLVRQHRDAQ